MKNGLLQFHDLASDPFEAAPHPEFVFHAASREGLIAGVWQTVLAGAPVVTMRGDSGLGKTSLLRLVAARLRQHGIPVVEADATTTPLQVQMLLGEAAGLPCCDAMTPDEFTQALRACTAAPSMAVALDDADQLSAAGFRMLALLQQLFAFRGMALRLLLVGAPGRWPGLDQPDLEELRQQCISHSAMFPLREDECRPYLAYKFNRVGVRLNRVMSRAAVVALSKQSGGVPARLDALAQDMLAAAYRRRRQRITLPMAWPAVCPDWSWTLPLTLVTLRSRWVAAFGMSLLAGAAVLAFEQREDWAASLNLQTARAALVLALSSGGATEEETGSPLASLPIPESQWIAPGASGPLLAKGPADAEVLLPKPGATATTEPSPGPATADLSRGFRAPERTARARHPAPRSPRGGPGLMLLAGETDTLQLLYAQVYRGLVPPPFSALVAANQAPVRPGSLLIFPEPPNGWARR